MTTLLKLFHFPVEKYHLVLIQPKILSWAKNSERQ